jgi:hypothetical protein
MLVNNHIPIAIVTPPRVASSFLHEWFVARGWSAYAPSPLRQHHCIVPNNFRGIIVVRHPIRRQESLFRLQNVHESWDSYVRDALTGKLGWAHKWRCVDYDRGPYRPVRVEHLKEDLARFDIDGPDVNFESHESLVGSQQTCGMMDGWAASDLERYYAEENNTGASSEESSEPGMERLRRCGRCDEKPEGGSSPTPQVDGEGEE